MRGRRLMLAVAAAALVSTACAGDAGMGAQEQAEAPGSDAERGPRAAEGEGPDALALGEGAGAAALPAIQPQVIKTAQVDLELERGTFQEAVGTITRVAGRHGGFVLSTTVEGEDAARGSVVLRVPSEGFEDALTAMRGLGTVRAERVTGEEVGQEFVDLQARLRNLEAHQAVLLRLMDEAASIEETIRVQNELSTVQLEIERIRGRLRYLRDQTALGTITVQLAEVGAPETASTVGRAWDRAVEVFLAVVSALIVSLGFIVPMTVLAALGLLAYRRLRPRLTSP